MYKQEKNMRDIKKLIIKYTLIIIGLRIIISLTNVYFHELTIVATEDMASTTSSFFGLYIENFYNIILAIFIFFELKKINLKSYIIPIMTILSSFLGLFFTAMLVIHHKIKFKK